MTNEEEFAEQVDYLGLRSDNPIEAEIKNSALLLQNILEKKLAMQPHDKDMIVMLHEIGYEINGKNKEIKSSLVVIGEDQTENSHGKNSGLTVRHSR